MNNIFYILCLLSTALFSQEKITATALESIPLNVDQFIGVDNYGTLYYTKNTIFYKSEPEKTISYSNVLLGPITSVDIFNPLKIKLFYKSFNTVILLDNRLSEISIINFSTLQPYKNVSHISTGSDNTLWIFNQDLQQLELFDYNTFVIKVSTMPVQSPVLDLQSNYNHVWLLTEEHLFKYNYFGSTLIKLKHHGFLKISEDNGNLVLQSNDGLFFLAKNSDRPIPIELPKLFIKHFLLTNETLYIYTGDTRHQFHLKIK